jgi:hypothetical protein
MARIISLKRDVAPPGDDATDLKGCAGEPAQIILFPGVRYERWHEEQGATLSPRRASPGDEATTRDWLEI